MDLTKRDAQIAEFKQSITKRVLLLSNVASVGLNLTVADAVIFYVNRIFLTSLARSSCNQPPTGHHMVRSSNQAGYWARLAYWSEKESSCLPPPSLANHRCDYDISCPSQVRDAPSVCV